LPTYQYRCTECDHAFDQFQSFTDDPLTVCPVCGGRLRKVFNAVGVVFKGSGFYRNDSRGNGTSASAPEPTGSSSDAASSAGSSDSSKSAGSAGSSDSSGSSASSSSTKAGSTTAS
jgi:putative FmdB family regulatory protein